MNLWNQKTELLRNLMKTMRISSDKPNVDVYHQSSSRRIRLESQFAQFEGGVPNRPNKMFLRPWGHHFLWNGGSRISKSISAIFLWPPPLWWSKILWPPGPPELQCWRNMGSLSERALLKMGVIRWEQNVKNKKGFIQWQEVWNGGQRGRTYQSHIFREWPPPPPGHVTPNASSAENMHFGGYFIEQNFH